MKLYDEPKLIPIYRDRKASRDVTITVNARFVNFLLAKKYSMFLVKLINNVNVIHSVSLLVLFGNVTRKNYRSSLKIQTLADDELLHAIITPDLQRARLSEKSR